MSSNYYNNFNESYTVYKRIGIDSTRLNETPIISFITS